MKGTAASGDYLQLARLVLRLSRHLYRTFDDVLEPAFGLTTKDQIVLRYIQDGERHPGGLSRRLRMPPASVSRVLERLETRGLIQRAVDPADHRRFVLSITRPGAKIVTEVQKMLTRTLRETYAHVPAEAIHDAVLELTTLTEVLEQSHR